MPPGFFMRVRETHQVLQGEVHPSIAARDFHSWKKNVIMADVYPFLRPPTTYLLMGGILFSAAVFSTFTGKISARFSRVYRAKEPIVFWLLVAAYYLGGVCFIGYFLYKAYRPSD